MYNYVILKTRNKKIQKESMFIVPNPLADIYSCVKHKQNSMFKTVK